MKKFTVDSSQLTVVLCVLAILFSFVNSAYARTAAENLAQVEKIFMEGRYERVIREASTLIDAGARGREELFYLKGLSQMQLKRFRDARETFRYMAERYPRGKRAFDGYIGIGDAFFLEGKIPESIASYNEAMSNYPDNKNMPVAYYKIGTAYRKIGSEDKAKVYLDKTKESSPLSFESKMVPDTGTTSAYLTVPHQEIFRSQAADTGDYFYVQVGYFKNKGNAQELTDGLKQKGYGSYIETHIKSGLTFYRVKVGRLRSKTEAENMAGRLRTDGYKTKICR